MMILSSTAVSKNHRRSKKTISYYNVLGPFSYSNIFFLNAKITFSPFQRGNKFSTESDYHSQEADCCWWKTIPYYHCIKNWCNAYIQIPVKNKQPKKYDLTQPRLNYIIVHRACSKKYYSSPANVMMARWKDWKKELIMKRIKNCKHHLSQKIYDLLHHPWWQSWIILWVLTALLRDLFLDETAWTKKTFNDKKKKSCSPKINSTNNSA